MQNNSEQKTTIRASRKQMLLWIGALVVGAILGTLSLTWLNDLMNFVATVYTRLFQFVAVPTILLAVITTLTMFGRQKDTGRIFRHAVTYTLLTTIVAAAVGLVLYNLIRPGNLPAELIHSGRSAIPADLGKETYYDHILSVIPDNVVRPLLEGNVLSLLLIAFAVGFALSKMPETENKKVVVKGLFGLQELLFTLIRGLIWTLPVGIVAFAAQLSAQVTAGIAAASLGRYVAVILGGNLIQFFIVLPLFLLARGLNPVRTLGRMMPAVLMALFTKSSAATLPTMLLWLVIAVISAVGNAGVPMGCYFLSLSLMTGQGAPVGIMGIILPIYTVIDMIETAENVWSDSCVCAMTDHDISTCPADRN